MLRKLCISSTGLDVQKRENNKRKFISWFAKHQQCNGNCLIENGKCNNLTKTKTGQWQERESNDVHPSVFTDLKMMTILTDKKKEDWRLKLKYSKS